MKPLYGNIDDAQYIKELTAKVEIDRITMDNFLEQLKQKDKEIESLSSENSSLREQLDAALELLGPEVETDPASTRRDCNHIWSDPGIDQPPVFCTVCLAPKVKVEDIDPASTRQGRDGDSQ